MSNRNKKRKRSHLFTFPVPDFVWAFMIYKCKDCGEEKQMFLERSLERDWKGYHKPVPFGIICRKCGGCHCYDTSGLIVLSEERPVKPWESYFKDDMVHNCGIPIWRDNANE